jgi:hypothetical protein
MLSNDTSISADVVADGCSEQQRSCPTRLRSGLRQIAWPPAGAIAPAAQALVIL